VGGVDYPRTLSEFLEFFPDEGACFAYLERLRWAEGFVCPKGHTAEAPWRSSRGLAICPTCRQQTSVTAGTTFQGTRKLYQWFLAAWEVTSHKPGASALGIQQTLGLGSYKTAWAWLHKLRRAMVRPGRDRLNGRIEVDETLVGGIEDGAYGRGTATKSLVVIATEVRGTGIGRIRLRCIERADAATLHLFLTDCVEPGSVVITDGWSGYSELSQLGYKHERHIISGSGRKAHELLPRVHRVASLIKRWLLGTHQGGVTREHIEFYLDEFTFRFNRRTSKARGLLFYRLLEQAVNTPHMPMQNLFRETGRGPRRKPLKIKGSEN